MAGGNEVQRSDRLNLPQNMAFPFIIRIFRQFHAVTALRSRQPLRKNENSSPLRNNYATSIPMTKVIGCIVLFIGLK
ncbi:MAG: hypothetical protein LBC02_01680 [Planctomycetaceae bacterium]|jgi:hypothetical protein|nr:hypothetical protein [Planctomycetaceae bacterium]